MKRVANFYNADIRNNGTARRVTEAMKKMGMPGFMRYTRPAPVIGKHDLHVFIDDGRDDIDWLPPRPNACWLIDTHLGYETRLAWARQFDWVFVAQKEAVEKMAVDGVVAHWLPLACSPNLDPCYEELRRAWGREANLVREYDCAFVGFMNVGVEGASDSHNRVDFLDRVFRAFPNSWLVSGIFFEQAALRYVKARVGLNISIRHDLNMRFFEALSYGVCQVCNRDMEGWEELGFVDGEDFLGFDTTEEAIEQVRWALEHREEREAIAQRGWEKVRNGHTYEDRIKAALSIVESGQGMNLIEVDNATV